MGTAMIAPRPVPDVTDDASDEAEPLYRIEHRLGDAVSVVGYSDDPFARFRALSSHAIRLLDAGAAGAVHLVDQRSGDVLARRALLPEARPAAHAARATASRGKRREAGA